MLKSTAFTAAKQANALPWVKKINSEWKGEIVSNISGSRIQPFPTVKKTSYHRLLFQDGKGMFCIIYRKHDTINPHNKSKKFNTGPP